MRRLPVLVAALVLFPIASSAQAGLVFGRFLHPGNEFDRAQRCIRGQLLDFSRNSGIDKRICSAALGEKRDLYVYLPPNYDPQKKYPFIIYLHGFSQDERNFLELAVYCDHAIRQGMCPPTIIAAPDGSLRGQPSLLNAGSFFMNSRAGRFEDFVMQDVWTFMHTNFSIRPEREAHALVGGSMGGFAAYNLGIKYREVIASVAGVFPPLNLRYLDCHGNYFSKFDPNCIGWRTEIRPFSPIARYYGGLLTVRERRFVTALYHRGDDAIASIAAENPVEMLETYDVRPGQLGMYIASAGKDEFNIDAQIESFLHFARCRGLAPTVCYLPDGHHNVESGKKFFPSMVAWLGERFAAYGPK